MVAKSGPICQTRAMRCMKVPLRSTEQIYLVFLIPTLISCTIYLMHFSGDFVVVAQHFREGNPVWGSCTLAIMYAPAVAYFVLTVSRPDWWMSEDDKLSKGIVTWFMLQILHLFLFPLFVLYRFAGLIVLAVDAITLSGLERTKTLNVAAKPAAIELYFFLQAWLQAAPQAMLQTHLLLKDRSTPRTNQSITVQVFCVFMSIVVLSVQTMSFQRFESQRINGRKLPWAMWLKKYRDQELREITKNESIEATTLLDKETVGAELKSTTEKLNRTIPKNERREADTERSENETADLSRQISVTPPLPPKNARVTPPPTPLRGLTIVTPLQVPDMPAPPRPDSMTNIAEIGDTEEQTSTLASEGGETGTSLYKSTSLKLPKRKYSQKGLDEDDPIGKAVAFLWWFLFIASRVFAIAVSYEFHPNPLFAVLGIHYLLMLCYLFYYAKDYTVTTFFINIWLGSVYIIGAIEYKIKYKYANKWLFTYYTFVMLQNTGLTLAWFFADDWTSFWHNFIFYMIFCSMGLCIVSTTLYEVLFKPTKRRIYVT